MTKGPLLRPQGVIITGKAFGNGIYFAPRAKKSIGYSSLRGAYWTHDAVYAHKGVILQNDEVIIFREEQATLQYIIELNA